MEGTSVSNVTQPNHLGTVHDPSLAMAALEPQWVVKPNMGRPSGRFSPVGVEHIYRDPDIDLPVDLLVDPNHPDSRGRHWAISWRVRKPTGSADVESSQDVQRVLHIVREVGINHYTNWGPKTRFFDPTAFVTLPIATMSLSQRKALEEIASSTEVYEPNGVWNCQDWIIGVLQKAVTAGLLDAQQVDNALNAARK
jgi:hypothetical protein